MGTNFCVCNDSNNKEQESNIFSIIKNSRNGKENELKTVTLQNKLTKGSEFKSIRDDNSTLNNKLDNYMNEIYKTNEEKNPDNEICDPKIGENLHFSGKFNEFPNNNIPKYNLINGKIDNEFNSLDIKENTEIITNGADITKKNNQLGFISFKSLIVDNNHNIHMKENKDNNVSNSQQNNKSKEAANIKKSIDFENNDGNSKIKENGSPIYDRNINYSELRYNDISIYSDTSDKDYLNYESDYHNSNDRKENRNDDSLFDEYDNNN